MVLGYGDGGHAFESRQRFLFIFELKNILRSNLTFSISYGRSTVLESLLRLL